MYMKRYLPWFAIAILLFTTTGIATAADTTPGATATGKLDNGDIAWMLISTALVFLMVPGLALFYGGMVRRKNILATMMHSMVALAVVGVYWVAIGYCLAFGKPLHLFGATWGGVIGWNPDTAFPLRHPAKTSAGRHTHPRLPARHVSRHVRHHYAGTDQWCHRRTYSLLALLLVPGLVGHVYLLPYCPLALGNGLLDRHWGTVCWSARCLRRSRRIDFAGGIVVHVSAGVSALAAILVLRKRLGYPEHAMHPNSMVLTLTGAGLLWFGWFGFNGGSAWVLATPITRPWPYQHSLPRKWLPQPQP